MTTLFHIQKTKERFMGKIGPDSEGLLNRMEQDLCLVKERISITKDYLKRLEGVEENFYFAADDLVALSDGNRAKGFNPDLIIGILKETIQDLNKQVKDLILNKCCENKSNKEGQINANT